MIASGRYPDVIKAGLIPWTMKEKLRAHETELLLAHTGDFRRASQPIYTPGLLYHHERFLDSFHLSL